jgi:hypothetical protein
MSSMGLLALLGCGRTPSTEVAASWVGSVDTLSGGVIHVSNPAEGVWGSEERGAVAEEVRIGRMAGDGFEAFGEVGFLELDPLGRIWVFENQLQELRVFNADGDFVRTVGGRGEGPGEFQWVTGMSWGPGERLWVLDVGTMRFSVFDTAGAFLDSHRIEGGSLIIPWPGGFDRYGRLHHYARRSKAEGQGFELVLVRYDTLMTPGDTVLIPASGGSEIFELRGETSYMSVEVPFTTRSLWRLSPGGEILSVHTGTFNLALLGARGDTLRIVSREMEPSPVTDAELEEALGELARFTEAGGIVDRERIPRVKPALEDVWIDERGRTWVQPWRSGTAGGVLDLFDEVGRYLGPVDVPFSIHTRTPPIIRGDHLLAVTRDDLDVPYVVLGRLVLPASSIPQ